jgi:hypothetical protein
MSFLEPTRDSRVSRRDEALEGELIGRAPLPRDIERATTREVAKQYGRGAVGIVRVETTARVTEHALLRLGDLEADEAAAVARDPMNAGRRQRRLVDAAERVFEDAIRVTGRAFER